MKPHQLTPRKFTLPDLEHHLNALAEGALLRITRQDYERLFGTNDAGLGRLRNFAKGQTCVASFTDDVVLFRKAAPARLPRPDA